METHQYKENKLSPGHCIACGLIEDCERHSKAPACTCNEDGYPKHKYDCPTKPIQLGGAELSKELENYERDYSHYHCFESSNPPCGLKGLHRCCLCEKPVPEATEKKTCRFHPNGCINDGIHPKAPKQNAVVSSLLQKERENLGVTAEQEKAHYDMALEAGKSEAFSLVRSAIAQNRKVTEIDWKEELTTADLGYNAALDDLLSTLEGK